MFMVTMPYSYLKNSLIDTNLGGKFKNVILSIILLCDAVATIKFSIFLS